MNTYEAASKAWAQGGVFGGIGAAIALAAGFMQVEAIRQTQAPKFATGGLVGGRRHSQGGTLIEVRIENIKIDISEIRQSFLKMNNLQFQD